MEAIINGPNGQIVLGPTPLTIGRAADNQLVVHDSKVSAHHAEISPDGQGCSITDLGSTNGTFVNGQRLEPHMPRQLNSGDTIHIGDADYRYETNGENGTQVAPTMYAGPSSAQGRGGEPTIPSSSPAPPSTSYGGDAMQGYQPWSPDYQQYHQGPQPPYPPSSTPVYHQQSYTPPPPGANQIGMTAGGGIPSYGTTPPQKPKGRSTGMIILIVAIVLLFILGSIGFLVVHNNQVATDNTHATATANVNSHLTSTAQVFATQTGIANAHATATATVVTGNPNPYPPNTGTLALYDPLKDNLQGYKWEEGNGCTFTSEGYQVSQSTTGKLTYCDARSSNFSNFAYRVEMVIIKGDCGGIAFRADPNNNNFYAFEACQDGTFFLALFSNGNGTYLLQPKSDASILKGMNQDNLMAVVAQGSSMNLYINNHKVASASDNTYTSGQVGVIADAINGATTVSYVFAKVWTLP